MQPDQEPKEYVALNQRCETEDQLYKWVSHFLKLKLPKAGVCPGHDSPFEYLKHAYFEPAADCVVWAPRGGGKTRLGAAATLLDLLHKPGVAVRILGGSLEQSLRMWEHLLPDVIAYATDKLDGKLGARRFKLTTGATAGVVTQSQRAVRGLRVQKLRCDEVEMFDRDVWNAAQFVTKTLPAGGDNPTPTAGVVEALSTLHETAGLMEEIVQKATGRTDGNAPVRVIKWCLLDVLEHCPESRVCATCPLHPECKGIAKKKCDGFVSIDDAIRIKRRSSKESWESEMLCLRPSQKGRVFGTFDVETHVRPTLPPVDPDRTELVKGEGLYLGIDFGFRNPFVCLWIRRDRYGRSFVIDEYVKSEAQLDEHIAEIKSRVEHGPVRRIGCDPAGTARNEQTGVSNVNRLRAANFSVYCRASKIQDGLELIRAGLKSGTGETTLFIHPRCKQLVTAMRAYRYDDKDRTEVPLKDGHDHLVDALRYYYISRDLGDVEGRWY
jgi:hypothetical protein